MLPTILTRFERHPALATLRAELSDRRKADIAGLGGSSSAFLAAALATGADNIPKRMLVILPDEDEAVSFRGDLEDIIGAGSVALFPERDTSPYEPADSHYEVRSRRVELLNSLEQGWHGIVVASAQAVQDPTTPPGLIGLVTLDIARGQKIAFDDLVRSLAEKGFKREHTVTEAGQSAIRGGIIDVFPFGGDVPYRIELAGDTVESIRTFSIQTQRSLMHVDRLRVIPPDECVLEAGLGDEEERRISDGEKTWAVNLERLRRAARGGDRPNGIEQYLRVIYGPTASLGSHFGPDDYVIVFDPDACRENLKKRLEHALTIWTHQRVDDPDIPAPDALFASPEETLGSLERMRFIACHSYRIPPDVLRFGILPSRSYRGNLDEVRSDITAAHEKGSRCVIACDNAGQADRLRDLLGEVEDIADIGVARLAGGFTDEVTGLMVFTDHEIFGRQHRRTRSRRFHEGVPIPDQRALTLGDFVVHVDYGVGRFRGIKRVNAGGAERDCLVIEYRGSDRLFVPVDQLKRLKKFTAEEGVTPVVNNLGGNAWERLKEKTKQSIERLARDLLRLYAERKAFPGHAANPDEHLLRQMEESFVYEETPDQTRAWQDVLADMRSESPMERLICGDVGFGKTEIAIRAAFTAVLDNRQVTVLAPTTILAEQHEETFKERLAEFPVRVASISRFRSRAEQRVILEQLAKGEVDILIGTHRLLSEDVHFKNLGLLVIDEEQRFGVRHKERIKKMRNTIDVLSMSATPIPRTLNMSLLGARDISFINTPPVDRYSVHTEVVPFEESYIIDAIMREIDRGGQVFFVHNRVQSINAMAGYLAKIMPSVSFCVAHGQMSEHELEQHMKDFYHRKYQVLVSTMIIENGLDVPNVNTILINRADAFGLSQLYQLRGRVGRSSTRAYAYLLVPPKQPLTPIARKRLQTIEELTALGSGFTVAMRDMEIRGAGNILGTQQSGFIAAVGFDLYCDLLNETIAELKGLTLEKPPEVEIHSSADAYLPEDYISEPQERVLFYRRLSETLRPDEVRAIEEELTDRFGVPAGPAANLFDTAYIRHYAALLGAVCVTVGDAAVTVELPETITVTREVVSRIVQKSPVKLEFSFDGGMTVRFAPGPAGGLVGAKKVLQALAT